MHVAEIGFEHLEENETFGGKVRITAATTLILGKDPQISNAIRVQSEAPFKIQTFHKPGDCAITIHSREE